MAYFQKAKALRTIKQWGRAIEAVEKAISLNARISRYHYVRGLLYRRLGEDEESRQSLATFQKLESEAVDLEKRRRRK